MGIWGGIIGSCILGCGSGEVGMRVGACTLSSGAGTDSDAGEVVGRSGMGGGLGAWRAVAWRNFFSIWTQSFVR